MTTENLPATETLQTELHIAYAAALQAAGGEINPVAINPDAPFHTVMAKYGFYPHPSASLEILEYVNRHGYRVRVIVAFARTASKTITALTNVRIYR